jgi:succinate dehydrogenase / fumarate reductase, cytochrome b subunit
MPARARPLSPFLIYRWQIGNTLSILHRLSGAVLALGMFALTYWLASIANGAEAYASAARLFASKFGELVLFGWILAFFYHLLNGVRHLAWDVGSGFERSQRRASGWIAALGAVAVTVCLWVLLHHFGRV